MRFAEERIFRESPNVFLCVSSFNPRAKALYERLGYEAVGELNDYIVRGHSEHIFRKTIGPIREFRKGKKPFCHPEERSDEGSAPGSSEKRTRADPSLRSG